MKAKQAKYTMKDFEREFATDDACLEWLIKYRFPSCETFFIKA